MNRQELDALMQQRARESRQAMADARPLIPYGDQVRVCDMWREQARLDAIRRERETRAKYHRPALTSLRGLPWEDLQ